ncbi:MATE family efflux transporter [Butyricicoccus faecihominis]|uniref:MATE family efflux transporter n=1 Tax=Butyricicoccus faecihominis TaxID=1712515 RepID=UPI00247B18C5|nr:MATE family efflux transporter [Butyricicoccus faecihominis]MCQ5130915.1 MATE family efflux transporter [Butyricicoccus faecihominis]
MKTPIEKNFWRFVLPSMFTMLLSGLYTIVDGFFVGHAVGDVGLAAIGLVWPVAAVLMALGVGLGAGGSVMVAAARGAGEEEQAARARGNAMVLLALAGVASAVVLVPACGMLARLLGARGEVYEAAVAYLRIIAMGGGMQVLGAGLTPLIRGEGRTVAAMCIMGGGLVTNILLDWTFTMALPWGLGGAAMATVLAQAVTAAAALCFLLPRLKPRDFKPEPRLIRRTAATAVAPFGLSLMPNLITVMSNFQCLHYGGDTAVAAYSVANYFVASAILLISGVGEGLQPLVSYAHGAADTRGKRALLRRGIGAVLACGLLFALVTLPARTLLPQLFAASDEVAGLLRTAMPVFGAAFPLLAVGKLFISYFYASGHTLWSSLLVYGDPLVFSPVALLILPRWGGLTGVWAALPVAQALVLLLLAVLLARDKISKKGASYDAVARSEY